MHTLQDAYAAGREDALTKFAATRAHKEIFKAMQSGDMARASRIGNTPGVMSQTPMAQQYGHALKDLGRGGEGLATAVWHPTHGPSVRKMYDPSAGVYSPTIIRRKEQMGSVAGAAKFLGASQTRQGTPMHYSEFVPGRAVTRRMMQDPTFSAQFQQAKARTQEAGRQKGRELHDLRPANAVRTPQGEIKFVDAMPFRRDEVLHPREERAQRASGKLPDAVLPLTDAGKGVFPNAGAYRAAPTTKQFKQHMIGGQVPRGTTWSTYSPMNSAVPPVSAVPAPLPTQLSVSAPPHAQRQPPPAQPAQPVASPGGGPNEAVANTTPGRRRAMG